MAGKVASAVIRISINGRYVALMPDERHVLSALRRSGVSLPTLCYNPRFKPRAVCRLCLVQRTDAQNMKKLVPACSTVCEDGDSYVTSSAELEHFRERDLHMLLSRHPMDCMACDGSGDCRLQDAAWRFGVRPDNEEHPYQARGRSGDANGSNPPYSHPLQDHSSVCIERDLSKCIDCGLCADACSAQKIDAIGMAERGSDMVPVTVFDRPLEQTSCISCGQCTLVCPTGALTEQSDWRKVLKTLGSASVAVFGVQVAPATRIAISESFGLPPGTISTGKMINALRAMGFTHVYDTNSAADLTVVEEAAEALSRLEKGDRSRLPLFSSCCPGWVNLVEKSFPEMLPRLSATRSPQQMMGRVLRHTHGPHAFLCSIMPCTAKKGEALVPGMCGDVNVVLTTRELAKMIRAADIKFLSLPDDGRFDNPMGNASGSAQLFATSGGVMEALLRTLTVLRGVDPSASGMLKTLQSFFSGAKQNLGVGSMAIGKAAESPHFESVEGTHGLRTADVAGIGGVLIVNGTAAAVDLLKRPDRESFLSKYSVVEVMACEGGCLAGGGEPKSNDPLVFSKRAIGARLIDLASPMKTSLDNPALLALYRQFGAHPLSSWSEEQLHRQYAPRGSKREVLRKVLDCVDRRDATGMAALFEESGNWNGIQGRDAIRKFIATGLPRSGGRHIFAESHPESLRVISAAADVCDFDMELDPNSGLIRQLHRRLLMAK